MTDTYRPGDIAMVDGKPAMRTGEGAHLLPGWTWLNGGRTISGAVGPVLGNVADIAATEHQEHEAAMDDYAAHTTPGNTWIEETE